MQPSADFSEREPAFTLTADLHHQKESNLAGPNCYGDTEGPSFSKDRWRDFQG